MSAGEKNINRDSVDKVLQDFDGIKDGLEEFCRRTKALIEACLDDAHLRYQSLQFRVKRKKKLGEKYSDPTKNYATLHDITDLAALRIIVYYEDEVDQAAEIIKREFVVDPLKSIDKRDSAPDKFGYYALNLVCTLSEERKKDVQFKKWAKLEFEIQITSVLRHAWSEIEHEWYDLKEAYPNDIKRKFYLLAALLEMAEADFKSLRDKKINYQRSVDVRVKANAPDVPIDAVSMKAFISSEPTVARMDEAIAKLFHYPLRPVTDTLLEYRVRYARAAGFANIAELADALRKYEAAVLEYVKRCGQFWPHYEGAVLDGGVSISHLAVMLIGAGGAEALEKKFRELGAATVPPNIEEQARIAADVVAKYK